MKLSEIIVSGKERLKSAGLQCADPQLHMIQIAAAALGVTPTGIYRKWEDEIGETQTQIETILKRRLTGEPFQYIVGHEDFWESTFAVGPGVLIPRRETECLVEFVLQHLPHSPQSIAELGAGSGNIGISVMLERPDWTWHAYELSPEALPYLRENAQTLLPTKEDRYQIHTGDFFTLTANTQFDALISNPPYVSHDQLPLLSKEVRHEPVLALDGGGRGMDVIQRLMSHGKKLVRPGGFIILEIGYDQEELARRCLSEHGWTQVECRKDYADLPRVLSGRRPN